MARMHPTGLPIGRLAAHGSLGTPSCSSWGVPWHVHSPWDCLLGVMKGIAQCMELTTVMGQPMRVPIRRLAANASGRGNVHGSPGASRHNT